MHVLSVVVATRTRHFVVVVITQESRGERRCGTAQRYAYRWAVCVSTRHDL